MCTFLTNFNIAVPFILNAPCFAADTWGQFIYNLFASVSPKLKRLVTTNIAPALSLSLSLSPALSLCLLSTYVSRPSIYLPDCLSISVPGSLLVVWLVFSSQSCLPQGTPLKPWNSSPQSVSSRSCRAVCCTNLDRISYILLYVYISIYSSISI